MQSIVISNLLSVCLKKFINIRAQKIKNMYDIKIIIMVN